MIPHIIATLIALAGLAPADRVGNQVSTAPFPDPPIEVVAQPVDGDCESWRPLFGKYGLPFEPFVPLMIRESRCSNAVGIYGRDRSFGPLQVNRFSRAMSDVFDHHGITEEVHRTPEGGVAAAAVLYFGTGESFCSWNKTGGYPCTQYPSLSDAPMFPNLADELFPAPA